MTKIPYTYEIVGANQFGMDVRFSNPEHGEMVVGVRLPYEGENLNDVIDQFSPALYWAELSRPKQTIAIGTTGTGETMVSPEAPELSPEEDKALWREHAVISQLQAHYTLKRWGLYDQVLDLVTAVGDPLEIAFHRAGEWRRASPSIEAMFDNITMPDGTTPTPDVVDQFFIDAGGFIV